MPNQETLRWISSLINRESQIRDIEEWIFEHGSAYGICCAGGKYSPRFDTVTGKEQMFIVLYTPAREQLRIELNPTGDDMEIAVYIQDDELIATDTVPAKSVIEVLKKLYSRTEVTWYKQLTRPIVTIH